MNSSNDDNKEEPYERINFIVFAAYVFIMDNQVEQFLQVQFSAILHSSSSANKIEFTFFMVKTKQ